MFEGMRSSCKQSCTREPGRKRNYSKEKGKHEAFSRSCGWEEEAGKLAKPARESFYQLTAFSCNVKLVTCLCDVAECATAPVILPFVTFLWHGHRAMPYFCGCTTGSPDVA